MSEFKNFFLSRHRVFVFFISFYFYSYLKRKKFYDKQKGDVAEWMLLLYNITKLDFC